MRIEPGMLASRRNRVILAPIGRKRLFVPTFRIVSEVRFCAKRRYKSSEATGLLWPIFGETSHDQPFCDRDPAGRYTDKPHYR